MAYPADLKYTKEHEWVKVEGNTGTIGITDYAQNSLGDIVFVELPKVERPVRAGERHRDRSEPGIGHRAGEGEFRTSQGVDAQSHAEESVGSEWPAIVDGLRQIHR